MSKVRKPRTFVMPESGAEAADCGMSFDRFVQIHASGTYEAKTVRRLAKWLMLAADWMEKRPAKAKRKARKDK